MPKHALVRQDDFAGLPPWMAKLRTAVSDLVTEQDVKEIVQAQVTRAKAGDASAIKFVFDQLLGGAALKGATFVQNNYQDSKPAPTKPTAARPGSADKVDVMARRATAGLPLHDPDDNSGDDDA